MTPDDRDKIWEKPESRGAAHRRNDAERTCCSNGRWPYNTGATCVPSTATFGTIIEPLGAALQLDDESVWTTSPSRLAKGSRSGDGEADLRVEHVP